MQLIKDIIFGTSSFSSPLQAALCLKVISEYPGITSKELAGKTGLTLSTATQILFDLQKNPYSDIPAPLIRTERRQNREKSAFITEDGRTFLAETNMKKILH